jgi:uncharacterized protein involved in cysteine biosynthesis
MWTVLWWLEVLRSLVWWLGVLGGLLLFGLVLALLTSMHTPPPDDDKPPPSTLDDI